MAYLVQKCVLNELCHYFWACLELFATSYHWAKFIDIVEQCQTHVRDPKSFCSSIISSENRSCQKLWTHNRISFSIKANRFTKDDQKRLIVLSGREIETLKRIKRINNLKICLEFIANEYDITWMWYVTVTNTKNSWKGARES